MPGKAEMDRLKAFQVPCFCRKEIWIFKDYVEEPTNKEEGKEWAYRLEEERAERFYNYLPRFLARLMVFRHWSLNNEGMMEKVEIIFKRNFEAQMEWVAS